MKTLYKKDSKGKIRVWKIWIEGKTVIQESGCQDGKLVRHETDCKSKNIGRSNETTPEEQAELEMESTYKSKLDEGYFKSIFEVNSEVVILPMLAKSYNDEKDKIDWVNAYVQRKYDGMRCLSFISNGKIRLMSRAGKEIITVQHINLDLSKFKGDIVLDGELFYSGGNFQENMRLIKKYRKGETEKIKYHVYDIVKDDSFISRTFTLKEDFKDFDTVVIVETFKVNNESELKLYHKKFIGEGFEGTIIRHSDVGYESNKRSSSLLKYKDFQDLALKVIDVVPSEQRPEWGQPIYELNNKRFSSGMKFSHKEREEWLKNKHKYIGKIGEIRFFEYSEDGIPRFPVTVGIRLD